MRWMCGKFDVDCMCGCGVIKNSLFAKKLLEIFSFSEGSRV